MVKWLALLALVLAGCADARAQDEVSMSDLNPASPWHLWGTSNVISLTRPVGAVTPIDAVSTQLAKVSYKRPESWRFWIGARLISGAAVPGPNPLHINIRFQVIVGLGRSVFMTPSATDAMLASHTHFVDFAYQVPVGAVPGTQADNIKYVTRALGPLLDDGGAIPNPVPEQRLIEVIVAENIQCVASMFVFDPSEMAAGSTLQAEVWSFFAPNMHMRPDWFQPLDTVGPRRDPVANAARKNRFRGNETGGS